MNKSDDLAPETFADFFIKQFLRFYDHGCKWAICAALILGIPGSTSSIAADVVFYRQDRTQDKLRQYTDWGYAEFQLFNYVNSFGQIAGLGGARVQQGTISTQIVDENEKSVWEPVLIIAASGTPQGSAWQIVGMAHGFEKVISQHVSVDGIDVSGATPEFSSSGSKIIVSQKSELLLPPQGIVVCARVERKWSLTRDGLQIDTAFFPMPGYEWFNVFSAMLPVIPNGSVGLDIIQMGNKVAENVLPLPERGAVVHSLGTEANRFVASHSAHPYKIIVSLLAEAPEIALNNQPLDVRSSRWVAKPGIAKLYVTDVGSSWIERKPAVPRTYSTLYQITK